MPTCWGLEKLVSSNFTVTTPGQDAAWVIVKPLITIFDAYLS